jgi:hypothetical protein
MAGDARVQKANKVLDEEIAALREQVALAKRRRPRQSSPHGAADGASQSRQEQAPSQECDAAEQGDAERNDALVLLDQRKMRLEQIREWITTDGDLLPLIARVAGNIEGKFVRRQVLVNLVLSTIFLIAGWLLSTVATPIDLGHIFRR